MRNAIVTMRPRWIRGHHGDFDTFLFTSVLFASVQRGLAPLVRPALAAVGHLGHGKEAGTARPLNSDS
jgi:hypothetical protein